MMRKDFSEMAEGGRSTLPGTFPNTETSHFVKPIGEVNHEFAFLDGDRTPHLGVGSGSEYLDDPQYSAKYSDPKKSVLIGPHKYPAWGPEGSVPLTIEEINQIALKLQLIFQFQNDSCRNMFEHFMTLLDSRALRLGPYLALRSLHGDYIGGPNANYRKWYFATEMDTEVQGKSFDGGSRSHHESNEKSSIRSAESLWLRHMGNLSNSEYATQVLLYLLIWGEAGNLRFMPECLCFIYKCCIDHFYSFDERQNKAEKSFLDHVIVPLYLVLREQSYSEAAGKLIQLDKDHSSIVGYDDMNQLFWHRKEMMRIKLDDKHGSGPLLEIKCMDRYVALGNVMWEKVFRKTYRESRTWMHVIVNFSRVLNIHVALFWLFTSFHLYPLYTANYDENFDNRPPLQIRLTTMALVGTIVTLVNIFATLCEARFSPRRFHGSFPVIGRLSLMVLLLALNVTPVILIFVFKLTEAGDRTGIAISAVHISIGILTSAYLIVAPSVRLFGCKLKLRSLMATSYFTADFHKLPTSKQLVSISLWLVVFASKLVESYFFLAVPLKAPIQALSTMQTQCVGDQWLGALICKFQPLIVLVLLYLLEFVLFLLDTYLWYVLWNTTFSVFKSFSIGTSIWTPWRNVYSRLPKRIHLQLLAHSHFSISKQKAMIPRIWNLIIVAMYRDHFLSIEQVQKLLYEGGSGELESEPSFFVLHEDSARNLSFFTPGSEAKRRIAFFAQSLTLKMPEVLDVNSMPTFSVLIPHYSEKIILLLKEIIQEEDKHTHVTLLEYLKLLYPLEWRNFVSDTIIMAQEDAESTGVVDKEDKLYSAVGFKDATPVYIMRTRIWALLRSQTLYRTVFGFMNYLRAIKMFYDLENYDEKDEVPVEKKLRDIHQQTCRKFCIVIAMQRYKHFNVEENECVDILLSAHPQLQISYIDEEFDAKLNSVVYYSCLIDGACEKTSSGREPKFRIRLPGQPILGDGKADNQNHSLIFTRGEYLQLIDANQDNYIEECLKVRSVLAEFEEQTIPDPYDPASAISSPVAIVGTREYIFSENTGILGDIAAGKEQTFGTLFARTLAEIGGKLHYGHPDFLNSIFMTTRGGVSKAQKGLHLNEDIYAGMTALIRGGKIKHCEYMQCGKGRDLGFTSILNFITKIGAGMGEQILSREYFYLGTQLSLDRVLSFYYAHLGFHLNNYFIIFSIQVFLLVGINVAALTHESVVCEYDPKLPPAMAKAPVGCQNLIPVVQWLEKTVRSIFFVFVLSLLPLAVHEVAERGFCKAFIRTTKHLLSLSPIFEVFVCRIYAQALGSDLSVGGAQYIATGRGFATKREKFADLYTRFGHELLLFGEFVLLLIIYVSLSIWLYAYIFFWVTVSGFIFAPFLFNPGQFTISKFLVDYLDFVQWLYKGNRTHVPKTWIEYTKIERSRLTGVKLTMLYGSEKVKHTNYVRPSRINVLFTVVLPKLITAAFIACAFLFSNSQNGSTSGSASYTVARVLLVTLLPLAFNFALMLLVFLFNIVIGWVISRFISIYPPTIAAVSRSLSVFAHLISLIFLWQFQNYNFAQTILGTALVFKIQSAILQTIKVVLLSKEVMDQRPNHAWWSGQWIRAGFGWWTITQPMREFVCKVVEQTDFAADFITGHILFFAQSPFLLIPFINVAHSIMLMWMKPKAHLRNRSPRSKISRKRVSISAIVFVAAILAFSLLVASVVMVPRFEWLNLEPLHPNIIKPLFQPTPQVGLFVKGLRKGVLLKSITKTQF